MKQDQELAHLEMSRLRVAKDLATATNPRYKELLQRTLDFLDARIHESGGKNPA